MILVEEFVRLSLFTFNESRVVRERQSTIELLLLSGILLLVAARKRLSREPGGCTDRYVVRFIC